MNLTTKNGSNQGIILAQPDKIWWKETIIYQIYPRSFQDSNGDGIGDLRGITDRLDYLRGLGIDTLWLSPIFASPNTDNGYDVSNYREIMSDFGTMEDFDQLLRSAHALGMRILLDLVVNHTSEEHLWFMEARTSRDNHYYDYYLWWPEEQGPPPYRKSHFDENADAWYYNPPTRSYYLHYFARQQPDLNWDNPEVRREVYEIMHFWLDKGIDGFRMDSIPYISKDRSFPEIDLQKYPDVFPYYSLGPHLHDYLQEMRREVLSHYDCMSVGEGSKVSPSEGRRFIDPARQELDMLYHFGAADIRNETAPDDPATGIPYSLISLKKMYAAWDEAVGDGWPTIYLSNHDQPRMVSRFGCDAPPWRELSAKMLTMFLLTMRGTPYWYAGDELGMANIRFSRIEDYDDIDTRNRYKKIKEHSGDTECFLREQQEVGRDNARTPYQWDDTPYAGFSTAKPWLQVNPNHVTINAAAELADPDSVLHFFKRVVALRKQHTELVYGTFRLLAPDNPQVFAYLREGVDARYLAVFNFSLQPATLNPGTALPRTEPLLHNYPSPAAFGKNRTLELRPYEGILYLLDRK